MSATMRLVRGSIIDLGKKEERPGGIDKDTSKSQCPQVASPTAKLTSLGSTHNKIMRGASDVRVDNISRKTFELHVTYLRTWGEVSPGMDLMADASPKLCGWCLVP